MQNVSMFLQFNNAFLNAMCKEQWRPIGEVGNELLTYTLIVENLGTLYLLRAILIFTKCAVLFCFYAPMT